MICASYFCSRSKTTSEYAQKVKIYREQINILKLHYHLLQGLGFSDTSAQAQNSPQHGNVVLDESLESALSQRL
jgi:hypothetical protein